MVLYLLNKHNKNIWKIIMNNPILLKNSFAFLSSIFLHIKYSNNWMIVNEKNTIINLISKTPKKYTIKADTHPNMNVFKEISAFQHISYLNNYKNLIISNIHIIYTSIF
jgi:hypothetical protein